MKRLVLSILLTIFIFTVGSTAGEVLTLDDCIDLALEKRASIIRARGSANSARAGKLAALGAFLPNLSASYSYTKGKERDITPPSVRSSGFIDVLDTTIIGSDTAIDASSLPTIFSTVDEQDIGPSKTWNFQATMSVIKLSDWFDYASASAAKETADLNVLASENDLIQAVKIAYYAYLASVQNVDVQEEAVKRADEQLKLIQSRYDLGSASISDVLKQKVRYGNDRIAHLRATNAVTDANANLAYTIGIDPREDYQFSTDYEVAQYDGSLNDAISFALGTNPSLLALDKTRDQAIAGVRSAKSGYLPNLSVWGSFRKFNGTQAFPFSFDYSSKTTTYGFQVTYNIFDGFFREKRVSDAKVFQNNANADLADSRNRNVSAVKTSYQEITLLRKQKEVSNENVTASEEDLKITQEKYNLGAATILDLLDAQVSLKTAQVALIQVEFDMNLAIARLENAMGKR